MATVIKDLAYAHFIVSADEEFSSHRVAKKIELCKSALGHFCRLTEEEHSCYSSHQAFLKCASDCGRL